MGQISKQIALAISGKLVTTIAFEAVNQLRFSETWTNPDELHWEFSGMLKGRQQRRNNANHARYGI